MGGPKQPRRSLLASVVSSVVLYGAPIWADALQKRKSYGDPCRRACRVAALRVACAYRTVSDMALSVVAGIPPVDLLAADRAERYRGERRADEEDRRDVRWTDGTMTEWQCRWDLANEGRWTHRIIPDVRRWTSRSHGSVNFQLTQVLTGHGNFRSYLYRFKISGDAGCPACPGVDEDVDHLLFRCPRFVEERSHLQALWKGPMTPEGIGACLLGSREGWDAVVAFATSMVDRLGHIRREQERGGDKAHVPTIQ
ncbi:hypothetical protein KM043_000010 [Ampulex compressa]|nr:hypothetical protein KM043_000010 [Ampulex compressa]